MARHFQGLTYVLRPVWLLAGLSDTRQRRWRRKLSERRTSVDERIEEQRNHPPHVQPSTVTGPEKSPALAAELSEPNAPFLFRRLGAPPPPGRPLHKPLQHSTFPFPFHSQVLKPLNSTSLDISLSRSPQAGSPSHPQRYLTLTQNRAHSYTWETGRPQKSLRLRSFDHLQTERVMFNGLFVCLFV